MEMAGGKSGISSNSSDDENERVDKLESERVRGNSMVEREEMIKKQANKFNDV